jgi:hypothetical protein
MPILKMWGHEIACVADDPQDHNHHWELGLHHNEDLTIGLSHSHLWFLELTFWFCKKSFSSKNKIKMVRNGGCFR